MTEPSNDPPTADPGIEVGGTTHKPPNREAEHREKAVEAMAFQYRSLNPTAYDARAAAESLLTPEVDTHLERMYFERFAERMLGDEIIYAGSSAVCEWYGGANDSEEERQNGCEPFEAGLKAALDSIREGQ